MRPRVALIDSGANLPDLAGGVDLTGGGSLRDALGHGTTVARTIRAHAPEATLFSVKIFSESLTTSAARITEALLWCADSGMDLVNLSLGAENGASLILPPSLIVIAPEPLPGAIQVRANRFLSRDAIKQIAAGLFEASPYPHAVPGVPSARGAEGVSFAVAHVTGYLACRGQWPRTPLPPPTGNPPAR